MKKVSVIIPVYNAESFVAETISSVLAQTYKNFEVIIVDDGTPDNSIEICQRFKDDRIRIIHQTNRGLPGARNTGINNSSGDYIAFLDADDLWLPAKLEKHVSHLEESPEVGISFSYSDFIDEKSRLTGLSQKPRKLSDITPAYILCRNPVGNGSAAVIRREVFEDIKLQDNIHGTVENYYFDERLRQTKADATDIECWLRISIQTNWKIAGIPEALTQYRINSGGLSSNAFNQLNALEEVIAKTRLYAPEVIANCESTARAYHLRYTSRRIISMGDGTVAVKVFNQALRTHWRILLEEPRRTLLTGVAAYTLYILPNSAYKYIQEFGLSLAMVVQQMKLQKK